LAVDGRVSYTEWESSELSIVATNVIELKQVICWCAVS